MSGKLVVIPEAYGRHRATQELELIGDLCVRAGDVRYVRESECVADGECGIFTAITFDGDVDVAFTKTSMTDIICIVNRGLSG